MSWLLLALVLIGVCLALWAPLFLLLDFRKDPKHFFGDFRTLFPLWLSTKDFDWSTEKAKLMAERRQAAERQRLSEEKQQELSKRAAEQKRREDARAACELLFHRYAHMLGERYSKTAFNDFLHRYMGDEHPAEYVEERGAMLQELILQHAHQIEVPKQPYTIASLAAWYKQTKEVIDTLPIEPKYRQAQLAQLNARYAELMQDLMENLRP